MIIWIIPSTPMAERSAGTYYFSFSKHMGFMVFYGLFREYQYFAISLLGKNIKKLHAEQIELLEYLITHKSWWDTVDLLAAHSVGTMFTRFPQLIRPNTEKWITSDHLWLQRTALLFQLRYKDRTDADLLFSYILKCAGSDEFFIRKAIGWALREYSKTNPVKVQQFVQKHTLSPLSTREALKVIKLI